MILNIIYVGLTFPQQMYNSNQFQSDFYYDFHHLNLYFPLNVKKILIIDDNQGIKSLIMKALNVMCEDIPQNLQFRDDQI